MKLVLLAVLAAALCAATVSALVPIDVETSHALRQNEPLNILVHFPARKRADAGLMSKLTRIERQRLIHAELIATAELSQERLRTDLLARGFEVRTFWLGNTMYIKKATPQLIKELRHLPEILDIEAEKDVAKVEAEIHEVFTTARKTNKTMGTPMWNLEIINAPAAWIFSKGYEITIANIDTGVRYTHEALQRRYRGNLGAGRFDHDYNWFDPRGQPAPYDNNGHGTHTMGSIIGDDTLPGDAFGVAPEALWIAAKGCASSSCTNTDLISSFQYLFAPTRQDGSEPDVSYAPQVISNSWGGGQASTTFLPYIEPHVEAGTVVLFSQGNSGSLCGTANSPGDLAVVIGVGSTNSNDQLSSFSSRGPGPTFSPDFASQKPDISAPGERVYSSYYTSDTAYATLSGTSMACPHAAGVVGLVLAINDQLGVDTIRALLENTSTQGLPAPNGGLTTCSGVPYTEYPNYHYGYGRIDALAAIRGVPAKN